MLYWRMVSELRRIILENIKKTFKNFLHSELFELIFLTIHINSHIILLCTIYDIPLCRRNTSGGFYKLYAEKQRNYYKEFMILI